MFLILTLLLGGVFLGVKAYEWNEKFVEHHIPGPTFHFEGDRAAGPRAVVLLAVFRHDRLHALHMVIGAGLLIMLIWQAGKGRFIAVVHTPVDMVGLYWHFVDIIWIFLFPLLYLIDRHLGK